MTRRRKTRTEPKHISDLPQAPAVYALYGGRGRSSYVAYVGTTGKLRTRIQQHLAGRDSSVSTGTSAAGLNPDYVTELRWWEDKSFKNRTFREAAELVAYEVYDPVLRSRGKITTAAQELSEMEDFRAQARGLLAEEKAAGCLVLPTLQDALVRLAEQERRLARVERELEALGRICRGVFHCPIPGCSMEFLGSRGGWDGHVLSLRTHPEWHPEVDDPEERKRLFKEEYGTWFR